MLELLLVADLELLAGFQSLCGLVSLFEFFPMSAKTERTHEYELMQMS